MSHQYTINQTYDANGRSGKRIETRHTEDENGVLEDYTETSYQLHSSALGGALIVEIDQWGGRQGHVYAGGELIADYEGLAPYTFTSIRHRNPSTGQWVKDARRTELDPLGADVGYFNVYAYNLSYSDIMGPDNLYYQRGNALDIRGGCALDGLPISCSELQERMERGTVEQQYTYPEFAQGQPHLNSSTERGSSTPGIIWHTQRVPIVSFGIGLFMTSIPVLAGGPAGPGNNNEGYYLDWRDEVFRTPQNPGPDVDDLRSGITKILKESRGRCAEFIASLINGTSTETNDPEFTDILEGFEFVRSQGNFVYGNTIKEYYGLPGATTHGSISGGDAQVELPHPWVGNNPTNNPAIAASQTRIQLLAVMHELIHLAGKRGYDDFQLASTVAAMQGKRQPDYTGMTRNQAVLQASYNWSEALRLACKPR